MANANTALLRLAPLLALIGGALVIGVGFGAVEAGIAMQSDAQGQVAAYSCPNGVNCTAAALVTNTSEYQLGGQFVNLGLLEVGLGVAFMSGGGAIWFFVRSRSAG